MREFLEEWWIAIGVVVLVLVLITIPVYWEVDSWSLHSGKIVYKKHSPFYVTQNCYSTGKSIGCYPVVHPESWTMTIEGMDEKGKHKTRDLSMSEEGYNKVHEGELYEVPGESR